MLSEATAQAIVRYGFPLFWLSIGVIQWFWPSAIFSGFSDEAVTPGARAFAILWLCVGLALALVFIPLLAPFGWLSIPGFIFLIVGILQWIHPVWPVPVVEMTDRALGGALVAPGLLLLVVDVV